MLGDVVAEGSRRRSLEALRDKLASTIDGGVEPRDLASLSRRLESVLVELDSLKEPDSDGDVVDDLQRKRSERVAGSAASGS